MDGGGQSQSPGITLNLFATTVFWSVPFVITLNSYGAPTFFISFFWIMSGGAKANSYLGQWSFFVCLFPACFS